MFFTRSLLVVRPVGIRCAGGRPHVKGRLLGRNEARARKLQLNADELQSLALQVALRNEAVHAQARVQESREQALQKSEAMMDKKVCEIEMREIAAKEAEGRNEARARELRDEARAHELQSMADALQETQKSNLALTRELRSREEALQSQEEAAKERQVALAAQTREQQSREVVLQERDEKTLAPERELRSREEALQAQEEAAKECKVAKEIQAREHRSGEVALQEFKETNRKLQSVAEALQSREDMAKQSEAALQEEKDKNEALARDLCTREDALQLREKRAKESETTVEVRAREQRSKDLELQSREATAKESEERNEACGRELQLREDDVQSREEKAKEDEAAIEARMRDLQSRELELHSREAAAQAGATKNEERARELRSKEEVVQANFQVSGCVLFNGFHYKALDNTDPHDTTGRGGQSYFIILPPTSPDAPFITEHVGGVQSDYIKMPLGWELAPDDPDIAKRVIGAHPWGGAWAVVVAGGNCYCTAYGASRVGLGNYGASCTVPHLPFIHAFLPFAAAQAAFGAADFYVQAGALWCGGRLLSDGNRHKPKFTFDRVLIRRKAAA